MFNLLKNKKGITLIALVITIIVLLILAGVSISMLTNNNGILNKAQKAVKETELGQKKENEILKGIENTIDDALKGINGENTSKVTIEEAIIQKETFKKTTQIIDKNGNEMLWVPANYKIVADVDGENSNNIDYGEDNLPQVNEGIVIEDEKHNQFVWVPVPEISEMYDKVNKVGQVYYYAKSSDGTDSIPIKIAYQDEINTYSEPNILSDYDSDYLTVVQDKGEVLKNIDDFKSKLQSEFDAMIESVSHYGGFYVGRFETGGLKEGETPVVQANIIPTTDTNWYYMYANSKKIAKENNYITSSMIWGCQWDLIMNWFIRCGGETSKYVTNSSGKGWHMDNYNNDENGNKFHKTGIDISEVATNRVNNIYDLAGNMSEWTLRVDSRGGRDERRK